MRVKGDLPPDGNFAIEENPQKEGFVTVRFFENVKPYTSTEGTGENVHTIEGYEYDEYKLEMENHPGLEADIEGQFDAFLNEAKLFEAEQNTIPTLKSEVARLSAENENLTTQVDNAMLAMCDMYEQMLTVSGGDV